MTVSNKIKGLSNIRRLPRKGKIRLGIKMKTAGGKEYPKEVQYFVCPPEVQRVYGEKPTEIDIMIPVEDEGVFFKQNLKWFSASQLNCKGDGEAAMRRVKHLTPQQKQELEGEIPSDENAMVEIQCPCPLLDSGECSQVGNLMVLLPRVSLSGVYQLDTGSYNNIVRINSTIDYIRALVGRIAMVPLKLRRVPESIEYKGKRATHYLLSIDIEADIKTINSLRQNTALVLETAKTIALPAPVESGPEPTGDAPIEVIASGQEPYAEETFIQTATVKDGVFEIVDSNGTVYISDAKTVNRALSLKGKRVVVSYTNDNGKPRAVDVTEIKQGQEK